MLAASVVASNPFALAETLQPGLTHAPAVPPHATRHEPFSLASGGIQARRRCWTRKGGERRCWSSLRAYGTGILFGLFFLLMMRMCGREQTEAGPHSAGCH